VTVQPLWIKAPPWTYPGYRVSGQNRFDLDHLSIAACSHYCRFGTSKSRSYSLVIACAAEARSRGTDKFIGCSVSHVSASLAVALDPSKCQYCEKLSLIVPEALPRATPDPGTAKEVEVSYVKCVATCRHRHLFLHESL